MNVGQKRRIGLFWGSLLFAIVSVSFGTYYNNARLAQIQEKVIEVAPKIETVDSKLEEATVDNVDHGDEEQPIELEKKSVNKEIEAKIATILRTDGSFNPEVTADEIYMLEESVTNILDERLKEELLIKVAAIKGHFGL